MESELTDEQKKFLAECEAEFSNRYTTDDKDFIQVHIVKPWHQTLSPTNPQAQPQPS